MSTPAARFEATVEVTGEGFVPGRRLVVDADPSATVLDLAEALGRLGTGTAGKFVGIWDGRAQLPGGARLRDVQLVHGQHLELLVDEPLSEAPVLADDDVLRLVVEQGPQAGTAWPVRAGELLHLTLDAAGYWTSARDGLAAASFETTGDGLVRCTRGPALPAGHLLLADGAFDEETFIAGSVIRVDRTGPPDPAGGHGESVSVLRVVDRVDHDDQANQYGSVPFRIRPRAEDPCLLESSRFDLPSHPSGTRPTLDFVTTTAQVMPSIAMVAVMSMATTFRPYYLAVPVIQLAVTSFLHLRNIEKSKAEFRRQRNEWLHDAEERTSELRAHVKREAHALRARNAPLDGLVADAETRAGALWRRAKDDADFLVVGLGHGDYQSPSRLVLPNGMPRATRGRWANASDEVRLVSGVPVEHDLATEHLAIVGSETDVARLATMVLLDLLLSHSPTRLTLVSLLPGVATHDLGWLEDFPHVTHKQSAWLGPRLVTGQRDVRRQVRDNRKAHTGSQCAALDEHLVVLVDERSGVSVADLTAIVDESEGHVHVVWLGSSRGAVPGGLLHTWVEVDGDAAAVKPQGTVLAVGTPPSPDSVLRLARSVRPLSDESAAGRGVSAIPGEVAIGGLIDLDSPLSWSRQTIDELRMDCLVDDRGLWSLDLVEAGPHILVGGMSGAGKSELLRSMICSAVTRYSPRELGLLLVDFKGGASLGAFSDLPHRVGAVTNLDDDVERLLQFLRREVKNREALFADYSGEYKDYRRLGPQDAAPPRLLVVFDEFADFVSQGSHRESDIIKLAQKGRGLGIHLVLATQSPGTAVTQQIRDNVGARFALKTSDAAASEKIIERPDAFRIPPSAKGRLFVRMPDGGVVHLQSAHTRGYVFKQREADDMVTIRLAKSAHMPPALENDLDENRDLAVLVASVQQWGKESG